MKGCGKRIDIISDTDIEWFYKINAEGLAMDKKDLHKILEDRNMPDDVKAAVKQVFPDLEKRKRLFSFF